MPNNTDKTHEATALLERDHATVKRLLKELKETTARGLKKRQALLAEIAQEIRIHARIEEELFYPAFHEAAETHDDEKKFFEAAEEHGLVDVILPKLEDTDPSSEVFGARAKVLYDLIEHHAEEEEEEMFPRARALIGAAKLRELGLRMEERKRELRGGAGVASKRRVPSGQVARRTPSRNGRPKNAASRARLARLGRVMR